MERYKGLLGPGYVCDVLRQTIMAERHEDEKLLTSRWPGSRGRGRVRNLGQDITSKTMTPVISVISQ